MNEVIYQIKQFSFSYPFSSRQIRIQGSLTILRGECILLQGASGSGKSTLLAALKGLIPHLISGKLSGEISFNGSQIRDLNERDLLKIGYLQQNPDSQLICRDVFSELAFGLENQGLSTALIEQKIATIANQFAISPLLTRQVNSLSGGEKQKINLLAILLLEPEVLLLDEPTAFLDPESAAAIMAIIAKQLQNKTVIIVEHNLHYLKNLVNRNIYIGADGNITQLGLEQIWWQEELEPRLPPPAAAARPLLELRNLSFAYPTGQPLLKSLNLELYQGEIIAIRGANGAGKSTLLRLISAVIPCQKSIYWQAQDIAQIKRNFLWQSLSLLWQNPEAHFLASTLSAEVNYDRKALEQVHLSDHSQQNPFNLSEGQKRRLSLAIVLQKKPQLLLLDEPTFGQDLANKQQLASLISSLAAGGSAFIIVSHDLAFIRALTNRVYYLEQGSLSNVSA